jgi:serine/threonine protein kinase
VSKTVNRPSACLSEEQFERLCLETSSSAERAECEEHLARCVKCRERLCRHRTNQGFLAEFKEMLGRQSDKDTFSFSTGAGAPEFESDDDAIAPAGPAIIFTQQSWPQIAGYRINREIYRGGQGTVYHAVQESTRRDVAIKVLRPSAFPTQRDTERFGREVQILAQLKHVGIVTIHDSGMAGDQHYFVMDYIAGLRLDEHIAEHQLHPRAILGLFASICDAVNAAHLKGVLHRDLKPGNILVDQQGQPHILDFGLAKLVGSEVTDEAMRQMTVTGQFFGSLPWASPEQAAADPARIDLRTDIYSLGVLLYQMLAGRFPYDVTGSTQVVIDRILTAEPAPLSKVARHALDGDIETIVLKCLQKSPDRRYETAGELARDVRRALAGEPIDARRDSRFYVLRKNLWRHRIAVMGITIFSALVLVGLYYWYESQFERNQRELLTAMTEQLWPPRDASIAENVRTALQLRAFLDLEQQQVSPRRSTIADRLLREQQALLSKIERVLVLDNLDEITALFARETEFEQVLRGLVHVPRGEDVLERIAERLALHLPVPLPGGRGQVWLNTLRMLHAIDPANARASEAGRERAAIIESLPIRYQNDFSQYDEGELVDDWIAINGVEGLKVGRPERALIVPSTKNTTLMSQVKCDLPGRTLHIDAQLRFEQYADRHSQPYLAVSAEQRIQLWTPSHAWLAAHDRSGDYVRVEIIYDRLTNCCDVIIDGEYVADNQAITLPFGWTATGVLTSFDLVATQGWFIYLDKVSVRSGDAILTAPYGDPMPLVRQDDLGLRLSGHGAMAGDEQLAAGKFTIGDLNDDGRTELLIADSVRAGYLHVVDISTEPFAWNVSLTMNLQSEFVLNPRRLGQGELAIHGLGYRDAYDGHDSVVRSNCSVGVYQVGRNFDLEECYRFEFKQSNRGCLAPLNYGDGKTGFAVGTHYYRRALDVFQRVPSDSTEAFTRRGCYRIYRDGGRAASGGCNSLTEASGDLIDLIPHDWDDDGDDDLFAGWGVPNGNSPVLMMLEDGQPVTIQPLTPEIGLTRVAALRSPDGTYLVSATQQSLNADHRPNDCGIRIWRADEIHIDSYTPPLWKSAPCDARGVTAGQVGGLDVFAVASAETLFYHEEQIGQTLHIELYTVADDRASCLWRTDLIDVPPLATVELAIADLDDDSRSELIVALGEMGTYVFTALR